MALWTKKIRSHEISGCVDILFCVDRNSNNTTPRCEATDPIPVLCVRVRDRNEIDEQAEDSPVHIPSF
jgi:hypothetical protein